MTVQELLDDQVFWDNQTLELQATMLDLVAVNVPSLDFNARLFIQHLKAAIARKLQRSSEA